MRSSVFLGKDECKGSDAHFFFRPDPSGRPYRQEGRATPAGAPGDDFA